MNDESNTKRFTTSLRNNHKFIVEKGKALAVTYLNDAADHMEHLQKQNTALEEEARLNDICIGESNQLTIDLRAEVARLTEGLKGYGNHKEGCTPFHVMGVGDKCTCRLDQALKPNGEKT